MARLEAGGVLSGGRRFDFSVFGVCSNQAKVALWRHDRMPLPLRFLNDRELVGELQEALRLAREVAVALAEAVRELARTALAPDGGNADKDRVAGLVRGLAPGRPYWSSLELPFRSFVVDLAEADDPDPVLARWAAETLYREAWSAFETSTIGLDTSARWLRAVTLGRQRLASRLGHITKDDREAESEQRQ